MLSKKHVLSPAAVSASRKKELQGFLKHAGIRFKQYELLNQAFSHRSYANENPAAIRNNEKLEFLGDSVLGLVTAEYLYQLLPEKQEGELARIKSFVVSEESLAGMALHLQVDRYLLIGKGEEQTGGRTKKAILADTMEAVIGAYYLDSSLAHARRFILNYLAGEIDKVIHNKHRRDFKTLLQEQVQKTYKTYPRYSVVKKTGPDHDRTFWVEAVVQDRRFGPCSGKNKKEAERAAAQLAYEELFAEA
ncbi:ribonuclease III [Spirochaeta africana]|uniref:Ribonuclease 3 n=1 Tax=Spirochaeta africana (strain ATCC 700263 / DSM 8902 / Z-7692) TaxID=889378 RepID=H9UJQ7_SPIAZ|nr:ribonuclease III [Spirochaeta africana]AFG37750.1 ribonuclease III [Spirochaeta africana DSM 8902]